MFWIFFCESKEITWIYGVHYNDQSQGAVKVSNRAVQNFFTSAKDYKKEKYNWETFYDDFLYTITIESTWL